MTQKELVKTIKLLIKQAKKDFGKPCPVYCVGCASCQSGMLVAYLEWWLDNLRWDGKVKKKSG